MDEGIGNLTAFTTRVSHALHSAAECCIFSRNGSSLKSEAKTGSAMNKGFQSRFANEALRNLLVFSAIFQEGRI